MTESDILAKALEVQALASIFKSKEGNNCDAMFLVLDENFQLLDGGGPGNPIFLLRVIPGTRDGKRKRWATATLAKDLAEVASILFAEAMKKKIVAFCTTFTGKSSLFGINDSYGQV